MNDPSDLTSHSLAPLSGGALVRYELEPCPGPDGAIEGLHVAWITLANPQQMNSYTTEMVKDVILAFRQASAERSVVAVVFTGEGTKAFCTGGNTKEYAEYYAGRPEEYRQYMRLFNDMVSNILCCDKPVICRVNGMRVAGGQEIGMACDYTIASDLALFGQAGPRHGSAPDGGSTDFLPLFVGAEWGMQSCTTCELWSAHKALRLHLISEALPVSKKDGRWIPNPLVWTDRWVEDGQIVFGERKTGDAYAQGKALLGECETDLAQLDAAVDRLIGKLVMTMPGCLTKTIESVRKHKLAFWDRNKESNRAWLALNMTTEALAGFRAFNEGPKNRREADFIELRRAIARGERWSPELVERILPR